MRFLQASEPPAASKSWAGGYTVRSRRRRIQVGDRDEAEAWSIPFDVAPYEASGNRMTPPAWPLTVITTTKHNHDVHACRNLTLCCLAIAVAMLFPRVVAGPLLEAVASSGQRTERDRGLSLCDIYAAADAEC